MALHKWRMEVRIQVTEGHNFERVADHISKVVVHTMMVEVHTKTEEVRTTMGEVHITQVVRKMVLEARISVSVEGHI